MSPLLVPLLAQLIDIKMTDRSEARYVKYGSSRYEGTNIPKVTLSATDRRLKSALSYGPRLTLLPLEREPRSLLVFHEANASVAYKLKRSAFAFNSFVGYGKLNFRFFGLQSPTLGVAPANTMTPDGSMTAGNGNMQPGTTTGQPTGGTPATGTPGTPTGTPTPGTTTTQPEVIDRNFRYYTTTSSLAFTHNPLKDLELAAQAGYVAAGGLTDAARLYYPRLSGFTLGVRATDTYRLSKRDNFNSTTSFLQTWSSNGNRAGTWMATEAWNHSFGLRTTSSLSAGINVTRFAQPDGTRGFSVFPNFQAGLAHQLRLGRGNLSLSILAYSSPALDPLRALVDPRVGAGANLTFTQGDFLASGTSNVAFSVAPVSRNQGAVDSAQAQGLIGYLLGDVVLVDGGVRFVRQAYQGITVLPSTWAAFMGVTLTLDARLSGNHK